MACLMKALISRRTLLVGVFQGLKILGARTANGPGFEMSLGESLTKKVRHSGVECGNEN